MLNLARHPNMRYAVFVINVGHGNKTEMGIETAKMRLRTEINGAVWPTLLAGSKCAFHQLIAQPFTAHRGADDHPTNVAPPR